MSYKKVIELAAKFNTKLSFIKKAEETEAEKFYWNSRADFRKSDLLLEEDLMHLKQNNLSSSREFKALERVRQDVSNLFGKINPRHPYEGLKDLLAWIQRELPVLEKINNLVHQQLQLDNPSVPNHKAKGIPSLMVFNQIIQDYFDAERNALKPTVPPPRMM